MHSKAFSYRLAPISQHNKKLIAAQGEVQTHLTISLTRKYNKMPTHSSLRKNWFSSCSNSSSNSSKSTDTEADLQDLEEISSRQPEYESSSDSTATVPLAPHLTFAGLIDGNLPSPSSTENEPYIITELVQRYTETADKDTQTEELPRTLKLQRNALPNIFYSEKATQMEFEGKIATHILENKTDPLLFAAEKKPAEVEILQNAQPIENGELLPIDVLAPVDFKSLLETEMENSTDWFDYLDFIIPSPLPS